MNRRMCLRAAGGMLAARVASPVFGAAAPIVIVPKLSADRYQGASRRREKRITAA